MASRTATTTTASAWYLIRANIILFCVSCMSVASVCSPLSRSILVLFMKATMMDQVLFNLNNSKASIEKMAEILKGKVKEMKRKEKELAAWKEKLEKAEELQGTVMQRDKLEGLLAWAQVHDQDLALEQARQKRDTNGPRALQAVSSKLHGHQEEHEEAMREATDALVNEGLVAVP